MEGVWLLLAAGIGYVASALQQWLADRRLDEREQRTRVALRVEQQSDRREAFQRETLLALQDALRRLSRATGAIQHLDVMHHRTTREPYARQQLDEEWNQKYQLAIVDVQMFTVRVMDDDLRHRINDLLDHVSAVISAPSESEAKASLDAGVTLSMELNKRIGELLRSVY